MTGHMTAPAQGVVEQVVHLSLELLSADADDRNEAERPAVEDLIPRPGSPSTALTLVGYLAVWERLASAPSTAFGEVAAEATVFCRALMHQGDAGAVRRGHDMVVALLWHVGFFDVEGLSGPAESARTGLIDLLVRLDRMSLELGT